MLNEIAQQLRNAAATLEARHNADIQAIPPKIPLAVVIDNDTGHVRIYAPNDLASRFDFTVYRPHADNPGTPNEGDAHAALELENHPTLSEILDEDY